MSEEAPAPVPKADALAMLGPMVELLAKGGTLSLVAGALFWQMYTSNVMIQGRFSDLGATIGEQAKATNTKLDDLAARVGQIEQHIAVADAIREREERAAPAKR